MRVERALITCIMLLLLLSTLYLWQTKIAIAEAVITTTTKTKTTTPIKHLIVIYQENVSFDHYFATYPNASNTSEPGEPQFHPKANTPSVNGLSGSLLTDNPMELIPLGSQDPMPLHVTMIIYTQDCKKHTMED
jgi:phospholipase C